MDRKRRRRELGKSLLILLLSASAIYLLTLTPLIQDSGILDLFAQNRESNEDIADVTLTAAARPARLAVNTKSGRYAVQYDQAEADELFAYLGPLLGEALISAGRSEAITEYRWRTLLQREGIYFDFSGSIPLSALSGWLQQKGDCILDDSARRMVLVSGSEDEVLFGYESSEDGQFYLCGTGLTMSLHLKPAMDNVAANGAYFAFEGESWESILDPYTLIGGDASRKIYDVTLPLTAGSAMSRVLEELNYTGRNHASVSGGELYLDGNDRLQVLGSGKIIFDAAQGGKYPIATVGEQATVAEAIEAARKLAENTMGLLCGEAQLYLISAESVEGGYCIRFGYRLDGSTVWLYDEGWAAEFYVQNNNLTQFTLYFRCYTASGAEALVLPMDKAAAILSGAEEQSLELELRYRDGGEGVIKPVWVADS